MKDAQNEDNALIEAGPETARGRRAMVLASVGVNLAAMICIELIRIPAGKFLRGSEPEKDKGVHLV